MMDSKNQTDPIVFFDGVCNLCEWSVRFIADKDKQKIYRFCPLQSNSGREILKQMNFPAFDFKTILLLENGKIYEESTAVLRVTRNFPFPWSMLSWFLIVPRFIRDGVYQIISKNRYGWFGKKDVCMIPTPDLRERFLDNFTQEKNHVA